ncbi:MAG: hypothetical protein JWO97_111 [Acidobacteria bacterium]|nr:hypothetical protein [Acidobacteriota bacterium]
MRIAAVLSLVAIAAVAAETTSDPPVEKTKKNIKTLTGMPTSQLIPAMAFMSNSLGVTCSHCHGEKWESDEKPAKDAARRMIVMQKAINTAHYEGKTVVTCNSCHQGHVTPPPIPLVASAGWNQPAAAPKTTLPAAAEVLEHYVKALGGDEALKAARGRTSHGEVTRNNGRVAPVSKPFTLKQEVPQKITVETELSYPPEANREFVGNFYRSLAIRSIDVPMVVTGVETIRGKSAYVVELTPKEGRPERLYFDRESGLLLRRYRERETPVGVLPEEYDYDDYRVVDGVKTPFLLSWSRADYHVTHRFDTIEPITP